MPNEDKKKIPPTTIEERLAEIEGKIASSWALKTRSEYEADFRERVKGEILTYTAKLVISAFILLGGAGYLFIKSAVLEVYNTQNKQLITDLKAKYENNLADERARFEWKRHHDYGKNYIYLAKFYWDSEVSDERKKKALIAEQFSRAETYFSYAMRTDPSQPTTYWELGELHYTYAKDYDQPHWIDADKALHYYTEAAKYYTDADVSRGWRADAYRLIGKIYLDRARAATKDGEASKNLTTSLEYLSKARDEYAKVIPESRDYNKDRLIEVDGLLVKISKGVWK